MDFGGRGGGETFFFYFGGGGGRGLMKYACHFCLIFLPEDTVRDAYHIKEEISI